MYDVTLTALFDYSDIVNHSRGTASIYENVNRKWLRQLIAETVFLDYYERYTDVPRAIDSL